MHGDFDLFLILLAGTAVFGLFAICQIVFHRLIGRGRFRPRKDGEAP